jgi:hypothetical protein
LSKRILFVTDQETVFHCSMFSRSESSLKENMLLMTDLMDPVPRLSSTRLFDLSKDDFIWLLARSIESYTCRHLTYPEDIENAFAGLASILSNWSGSGPMINGILPEFFNCSIIWAFDGDQDTVCSSPRAVIGRRAGFPSWSWTGWIAAIRLPDPSFMTPIKSLIINVKISVVDRALASELPRELYDTTSSSMLDDTEGQKIGVISRSLARSRGIPLVNTLSFTAEGINWSNFQMISGTSMSPVFSFSRGNHNECGILSVSPDDKTVKEISDCSSTSKKDMGTNRGLKLIRISSAYLQPWQSTHHDSIQLLLEAVEETQDRGGEFSAVEFRHRLQKSGVLNVLLIKDHGSHAERVGSGFMLPEAWLSEHYADCHEVLLA